MLTDDFNYSAIVLSIGVLVAATVVAEVYFKKTRLRRKFQGFLLLTTAVVFSTASFRDPGFLKSVHLELPTYRQTTGTNTNSELNPETKSGHSKQIDSIASNAGLLSRDTKSTPATDASYLVTTPAIQSPRDIGTPPLPGGQRDEDGPINASMLGGIPLPSDRESMSYEGEIVEHSEHDIPSPAAPIPMPPPSEEKHINIETRFCVICSLEQPLRAKHCRDCGRCVALHDHHCPWLGICVAERNRFRFYWYLVSEDSLLWLALILVPFTQVTDSFTSERSMYSWLQINGVRLLLTCFLTVFCAMVTCLLTFHTYLACTNITTWERISWEKISYLKEWPRRYGSPFSQGIRHNLYQYCCAPLPELYTVWAFPQTLPTKPPARRC